jgi:phosphoribosylformimino-5-aminoimidazole carboxamide ribotide isomerase
MLMDPFTVYPAIDLRAGAVVRLVRGDPAQQTVYGDDPAGVASRWLAAGATWLHVVDLDGAFTGSPHGPDGDQEPANLRALGEILATAAGQARVQFGGGLRALTDIERVLSLGVGRAILGTAAVESPELVAEAVARFGRERVGVGIDVRRDRVSVRGWTRTADVDLITLGKRLVELGVRTVVYTNINRDGVGSGVDVAGTRRLAEATGLSVIASGGVAALGDVRQVRTAGLSGILIGRALYEGGVSLKEALAC